MKNIYLWILGLLLALTAHAEPIKDARGGDISFWLNNGTTTREVGRFNAVSGSFQIGQATNYVALKAPASSSNPTWTLPGADGTAGQVLATNGSGALSWSAAGGGTTFLTSTDYTLTDTDGIDTVIVTTDNSVRVVRLPGAAANPRRTITVKNNDPSDSSFTQVSIFPKSGSSDTIDGLAGLKKAYAGQALSFKSDGVSNWELVGETAASGTVQVTFTQTGGYSEVVNIGWTKHGKTVNLSVPAFAGTATASSVIASSAALPTELQPTLTPYYFVPVLDGTAQDTPGILRISGGFFHLWKTLTTSSFTSGQSAGLNNSVTLSYDIAVQ